MADSLPKEQVDMLKTCFDSFDVNKVGYIGPDLVKVILELMGFSFSSKELKALILEIDEDGSGQIEFEEFIVLCSKFMTEESEDNAEVIRELKQIFKLYDRDGVGYFTCDCLKEILTELDPTLDDEDLDDIVEEVDLDHNNKIDFDEFCKMMIG